MPSSKQITLVEDDVEISRLTTMLLECEGYRVSQIYRGDEAIDSIQRQQPDAVILDIMLPGLDGIQVCEKIREFYRGPILMLTGSDEDICELASFNKGADDYVRKPFKPNILVARLRALLRRLSPDNEHLSVDLGGSGTLEVLSDRREVKLSGHILELTTSEFDLLNLLMKQAGYPVSREQCCKTLRGLEYDGLDRSIDMKISALRKKLDRSGHGSLIKTVRGKGYLFSGIVR